MKGRSGERARERWAKTSFSSIMARMSSAESCSTLATSCKVRKPSKKCMKGRRASRVAAWAISAISMTSCTELEESMPKPVERALITSLWSPKMERAWAARVRDGAWIARLGQIQDPHHVDVPFARTARRPGTRLAPALQNPGTGEHSFQLSELMDRWLAARDRGKTQIGNFSGRPIGTVMYSSAEENAGADVGTYIDEGQVPDVLRGAAIVFALRGKIHIVFNDHEAASDLAEHGSQGNRAPALEGADRKYAALIHICDGRHADHQRQQLVQASRVFAQKFLQLVAN